MSPSVSASLLRRIRRLMADGLARTSAQAAAVVARLDGAGRARAPGRTARLARGRLLALLQMIDDWPDFLTAADLSMYSLVAEYRWIARVTLAFCALQTAVILALAVRG